MNLSNSGIAILFFRGVLMLAALAALRLTYNFLNSDDFVKYNIILLFISGGMAFTLWLNRIVWLKPLPYIRDASLSIALIFFFLVGFLYAVFFYYFQGDSVFWEASLFFLAAAPRLIDRFYYNFFMSSRKWKRGMLSSSIYLLGDLFLVLVLVMAFSRGSIELRIFASSSLVLAMQFALLINRTKLSILIIELKNIINNIKLKVILIQSIMWVSVLYAGMLERSLLPYLEVSGDIAPFLLVLSYGISFNTLMQVLIDRFRGQAYIRGRLHPNALKYLIANSSIMILGGVMASLSYIFLKVTYFIPESIPWYIWVAIITKYTNHSIIQLLDSIDILEGRFLQVLLRWSLLSVAYIITYLYINNYEMAAIVVALVSIIYTGISAALRIRSWGCPRVWSQ